MNVRRSIMILIGAAMVMASPANGAPGPVFKPAGPWAMEYADEGCRLIRTFSDGGAQLTVALERFALEPALRLGLTGGNLRASKGGVVDFHYGDSALERQSDVYESTLADGRKAYLLPKASLVKANSYKFEGPLPDLLAADVEAAKHISTVTISRGFGSPVTVDLGPMVEPIKAMQTCVADFVASWGVDVPRLLKAAQPATPVGNPASWILVGDAPSGLNGLVSVRVVVGEDGAIGKCMVDVTAPGALEQLVCDKIAKRAKFTPALDAEGKPLRSYWAQTWRFASN